MGNSYLIELKVCKDGAEAYHLLQAFGMEKCVVGIEGGTEWHNDSVYSHRGNQALNSATALVFGSESSGISPNLIEKCHYLLQIPTYSSSINCASSAAMIFSILMQCRYS